MKSTYRHTSMRPWRQAQQGVVLIISLVILLVITLIAVSGMNTSLMQEKMAANAQNGSRVFQAAESAVGSLAAELSTGVTTNLEEAMTKADKFSTATSYSIGDTKLSSNYQTRYLGEVIITEGNSIDADESGVQLKSYRFELIGTARMDATQAYSRIFQGIEYR